MTEPALRGVRRVEAALRAAGHPGTVHELHDSTRSAAEAAATLGVDVAQIAKTLVFEAGGAPIVVVVSGADRVDPARLSTVLDGAVIGQADADAVRAATGYAIGGVSPAGLPEGLGILVDERLRDHETIWAAAGTPTSVFPTTFADLVAVTGARVVAVAADR